MHSVSVRCQIQSEVFGRVDGRTLGSAMFNLILNACQAAVYMPTIVSPCSMTFPAHLQRFCTRPTLLAKHVFGVVVNLRSKDNGGHAK